MGKNNVSVKINGITVADVVTDWAQLTWYKPDPTIIAFNKKIAAFVDIAAEEMPNYVIPATLIARAIEQCGHVTEKNPLVERVRRTISSARKVLEDMPSHRYLLVIPKLGYRATVDDLDRAETISAKADRKASQAIVANARVQSSINIKNIPVNEHTRPIIAAVKVRKHYTEALEKVATEEQKALDALKSIDI